MYDRDKISLGMIYVITSLQNNQVKHWRKLHTRKYRNKTNSFLIEGFHLLEEARKSNWQIDTVIVKEDTSFPSWVEEYELVYVSDKVFKEITQTESPQGIIAEVKMKTIPRNNEKSILLIDAVQDPGNLGTMIRTADAAGFSAIGLGVGTVDPFNEKVIRASQGSLFHIPIYQTNLIDEIKKLKEANFSIFASALEGAKNYLDVEVPEKVALIVGNEGAGINQEILALADKIVIIPIYGRAESLNVSVAAGILMYHISNHLHK